MIVLAVHERRRSLANIGEAALDRSSTGLQLQELATAVGQSMSIYCIRSL